MKYFIVVKIGLTRRPQSNQMIVIIRDINSILLNMSNT